jgi:hypothetical protein
MMNTFLGNYMMIDYRRATALAVMMVSILAALTSTVSAQASPTSIAEAVEDYLRGHGWIRDTAAGSILLDSRISHIGRASANRPAAEHSAETLRLSASRRQMKVLTALQSEQCDRDITACLAFDKTLLKMQSPVIRDDSLTVRVIFDSNLRVPRTGGGYISGTRTGMTLHMVRERGSWKVVRVSGITQT